MASPLLSLVQAEICSQVKTTAQQRDLTGALSKEEAVSLVAEVCFPGDQAGAATILLDGREPLDKQDSIDNLLTKLSTPIGPSNLSNSLDDQSSIRRETLAPVAQVSATEVTLLVPDDEAAAVASKPNGGKRRLLRTYSDLVWKLKTNWIKNWRKQTMWVGQDGIAYSKQASSRDQSIIALGKITSVSIVSQESVGPKIKLKPQSFMVETRDSKMHIFSSDGSQMTAAKWCKAISSHVLLYAVLNKMDYDHIAHFIDLGGDVNSALPDGAQYPLVALAVMNDAMDVATLLLRRGADPSPLLRWSFLMIDKVATPQRVLKLLIDAQKDLNVVADDLHAWSLLHYLAYDGDLDAVRSTIARIDVPSINYVNTLGDSSLVTALKRHENSPSENIQQLCLALAKDANVDHADKWGDTALHLAIRRGHDVLARRLVEKGAKIDVIDSGGDTALHSAIKTGAYDLARWLVLRTEKSARKALLDIQDEKGGDTAFCLAIKLGKQDLALFYLENEASTSISSKQWNLGPLAVHDIPLHVAIKMGMENLAQAIVKGALSHTDLFVTDTQGFSALVLALQRQLLPLALVLIDASKAAGSREEGKSRSALDVPNKKGGNTALHFALQHGLITLASTIVDAGASVNIASKAGMTAMHECVELLSKQHCSPQFRKILLCFMEGLLQREPAANLRLRSSKRKYTPLHQAIHDGHQDAAALFLRHDGALGNAIDRDGNSCLGLAILENSIPLVRLLISHGADVDVVNDRKLSLLHLATSHKNCEIITLLLEQGAYPGVWNDDGRAPLHEAVIEDQDEIVSVFASRCLLPGNLDMRTEDGRTPLILAIENGSAKSAKVLLQSGVDTRARVPRTHETMLHVALRLLRENNKAFSESHVVDILLGQGVSGTCWDTNSEGLSSIGSLENIRKWASTGRTEPTCEPGSSDTFKSATSSTPPPTPSEADFLNCDDLAMSSTSQANGELENLNKSDEKAAHGKEGQNQEQSQEQEEEEDGSGKEANEMDDDEFAGIAAIDTKLQQNTFEERNNIDHVESKRPQQLQMFPSSPAVPETASPRTPSEADAYLDDSDNLCVTTPPEEERNLYDRSGSTSSPNNSSNALHRHRYTPHHVEECKHDKDLGGTPQHSIIKQILASSVLDASEQERLENSTNRAPSAMKVRLQKLPLVQQVEILEQIKLEGRRTGIEWLESAAGETYLDKKAKKLQLDNPGLDYLGAIDKACASFMNTHMDQWMQQLLTVQTVPSPSKSKPPSSITSL